MTAHVSYLNTLFRRFSIKVFAVRSCISPGLVHDPISVIRWRINRIELEWLRFGVSDVVSRSSWNNHREPCLDQRSVTIKYHFARSLLDPKELIELMNFRTDFLAGLERH